MQPPSLVLILAAGEGTRMRSDLAKVLHPVLGRPMLGHVINAAAGLNPTTMAIVTGAGRDQVESWLVATWPQALTTLQQERRGTGHAVRVALEDLAQRGVEIGSEIVVLTGDTPLLTTATLEALLAAHRSESAAATVLTAVLPDATGYGRIVRDPAGAVEAIVEHKDASQAQREIREINSGMYVFSPDALLKALGEITTNNAQGEEYLTDVLAIERSWGLRVAGYTAAHAEEIAGVNDREQLATASAALRDRVNRAWMREGVTIVDPATTWIESDVVLARDVTLEPSTYLRGRTAIAEGAVIGPDTTLIDCTVDESAHVVRSHATEAHIGPHATVGPFSFLRPGAELHEKAKVGAYVEIKNAIVGRGSKVPHLSYVGDAEIGVDTNIGAATIFVNYDGVKKHRTIIGDSVRIGSDSMLVAPVTVGDGAYTAAGSVITEDVPPGSMAVARAKQRNILGWVKMKRAGSTSDIAATKALNNTTTETEKQ